ncbi:conserved hypothetical protein [Culex quinquefasciatus]|uniref:Chitin-binding type-2 domain-containing protein n=1 Tax=Culex quinquefasciatus TaxID=7176 RepID=B0WQH3_CULQU|nr:uncharacterized protein LOC6041737 [Culex quinquefasciatus]XP_039453522.1 uncharacterized protein LOC120432393 [Culex pipiens pallens]EDS32846.1 conserved hypothetical protein [Culex quinquefasciatus]|eukprot:XP_001850957.1 conserved hypothetical protein [Culex quinquefasciatus]
MKFLWLLTFLLALFGAALADSPACPAGFSRQASKCVSKRPVHGECPKGSKYNAGLNLCVHN